MRAIFATDTKGGMGFKGNLPWPKIVGDFKWFQAMTWEETIVMGRTTHDTLPPLPGRRPIIITNRPQELAPVGQIPMTLEQYLKISHLERSHHFLIGGPKLINTLWYSLREIFLTTVSGQYETDVGIDRDRLAKDFTPSYILSKRDLSSGINYHIYKYRVNS